MVTAPSPRQGQTPFDVADEGLVEHLEALQKKQSVVSVVAREAMGTSAGRASFSWVLQLRPVLQGACCLSGSDTPELLLWGVAQSGEASDGPKSTATTAD